MEADELQGQADTREGCPGTNADGSPCGVPVGLLLESGYCWSHDPDVPEADRLAAKRNGAATMRLKLRKGLDPDSLGPLKTPEDAARWAEVIARACACGQLSSAQATAATRALAQWTSARELHVRETRLTKVEEVLRAEGRL